MKLLDTLIVKTLPLVPKPVIGYLSKSYIAGDNLDSAVRVVKELNKKGFCTTIDVLGEFIDTISKVPATLQQYEEVLHAIKEYQLDSNISVKPTSFGLLLDVESCKKFLGNLLEKAKDTGNFLRIDMEDSPCTDLTLNLYQHFRKKYSKHVGVVLQSYMRRTIQDVKEVAELGAANFRLCKGIYVEPEEIAFKEYQAVRDNFVASLDAMLAAGAYVGIATHDAYLVEKSEQLIQKYHLKKNEYEFQMLLGVQNRLRDKLRSRGHKVRIYVPFGKDWYGYSTRRLKENPSLAGTFFKAIFFPG